LVSESIVTDENTTEIYRTYTVVLRCRESLIRIPHDRAIQIAPMRSEYGDFELTLRQRTDTEPHISTPIPRELWIEVKGPAPSLEAAINLAAATSNDYVRQLAFGANAWHGLIQVHLAYGNPDGTDAREFFQNWIVDERGLPRVAREVDADLMYRLHASIASVPEHSRSRILRAVVQYTDALQHWKPGSELYALAHLYMGVEAVTPLVIEREIMSRGLKNRKELESALNGPPPDSRALRVASYFYRKAGGYIPSRLEPWARRDVIFRGDKDTYCAAQRASNQFEHGLAHHAEIHALAVAAISKTAEYLRESVLDLLPLSSGDLEELKRRAYAKPMGAGGYDRWLLGRVTSSDGQFALPDQLHPYVRWELNLVDYTRMNDGGSQIRVNQKILPFFSPSASLTVDRIRFAGPTPTSHTNVEFDVSKGEKSQEIVTKAGAHLAIDLPSNAEWAFLLGSYALNTNSLPHLARFWVATLESVAVESVNQLTLTQCVERICGIVRSNELLSRFYEECESLWKAAIEADDVRCLLSLAFVGEKGLVVPIVPVNGQASEVTDPGKLRELNDHTVELAKQLAALLDRVVEQRDQIRA
jgi:hypothetical protein